MGNGQLQFSNLLGHLQIKRIATKLYIVARHNFIVTSRPILVITCTVPYAEIATSGAFAVLARHNFSVTSCPNILVIASNASLSYSAIIVIYFLILSVFYGLCNVSTV